MRTQRNVKFTFAIAIGILMFACAPAYAQWEKIPTGSIPRGPDGKPNLSAPAPRTPDGHPDLSGIWEPAMGGRYVLNVAADLKPSDVPFQPWAKTLVDKRADGSQSGDDPTANCQPAGVPRIAAAPPPWKVIQTPTFIVVLYEAANVWRQIFLDGRQLSEDFPPTWFGYSTGKWEDDTLVVETKGFNGKAWMDQAGKPISEALHVTERFRRKDFGHMDIQITIDDPKVYTKSWTVTEPVRLLTNTELMEAVCSENNLDVEHLKANSAK